MLIENNLEASVTNSKILFFRQTNKYILETFTHLDLIKKHFALVNMQLKVLIQNYTYLTEQDPLVHRTECICLKKE